MKTAAVKSGHYDQDYFGWQSGIGAFGGWANRTKFSGYLKPDDNVLDFGCGGGFLLKGFECAGKLGIEINPSARANAAEIGIKAVATAAEVPDGWAHKIVSNHALEHCEQPLHELRALLPKLRPGGRAIFVVPCETITAAYRAGDINQHLYTWSPMNLGNLFSRAGFQVEDVHPYIHKWPPHYERIARFGGRALFDLCARLYARWERTSFQVRLIARRV